jgi:hypothetical protein
MFSGDDSSPNLRLWRRDCGIKHLRPLNLRGGEPRSNQSTHAASKRYLKGPLKSSLTNRLDDLEAKVDDRIKILESKLDKLEALKKAEALENKLHKRFAVAVKAIKDKDSKAFAELRVTVAQDQFIDSLRRMDPQGHPGRGFVPSKVAKSRPCLHATQESTKTNKTKSQPEETDVGVKPFKVNVKGMPRQMSACVIKTQAPLPY